MCRINEDPEGGNLPSETYSISCDRGDKNRILSVLGGDARQLAVSAFLVEAGYRVRIMGLGDAEDNGVPGSGYRLLGKGVRLCHDLRRTLEGCDGVVLPYPSTKDGLTVPCPLDTQHTITLEAVGKYLSEHPSVPLFGGRLPAEWTASLRQRGCSVTDYEDDESFLIKNARLTAEGAVMTAMELTDTALLNTRLAVVGYGRIGQLLAQLLTALGGQVTVFARRRESLALAEAQGCRAVHTEDVSRLCHGYRVIFNTVPARIISKEILTVMPCDTLIIELASAPGGLDPDGAREATRRCGLQIVRAPSLPGRYAPWDAGRAIADCILSAEKVVRSDTGDKEVIP